MLALIAWVVVPFDDGWVISNINIGILYLFAVSSLEVYGVIMGAGHQIQNTLSRQSQSASK